MVDPINTGQPDEDLEQIRTVIRSSLEKTDKGGTANTIQNCVTVFENDPLFAGKISRNLLTETNDMIGYFPWQRDGTRFDDQDLPHVLLHFEQHYGIRSEKCIDNAFRVVASQHSFHPIRDHLAACNGTAFPVCDSPCGISSARRSAITTKPASGYSCWEP